MGDGRFAQSQPNGRMALAILAAALALGVAACGPDSNSNKATPTATASPIPPPGTGYLFVANGSGPNVLTFKATANGDVAPTAILKSTSVFSQPEGVVIDQLGDILVGDEGAQSLLTFPYAVSGVRDIPPTTAIAGLKAGAIALDAFGNIYVVDEAPSETGGGSVVVISAGSTTQSCTISYSGFVDPEGIAIDSSTENIWVSDVGTTPPTIFEFPAVSGGCPTTPIATLSGASTTMQYPYAVTFDTTGNLWVADAGSYAATVGPDQVLEFSSSSLTGSGNIDVAPQNTITGAATKLNGPEGIAIGPGDETIVTNDGAGASTSSITTYASAATGNAAPIRTIAGSKTGLNEPEQVWFFAPSVAPIRP